MRRKISIVTGSRAEYGLLYWLMREVQENPDLELHIMATAMHLSPEFGLTYRQIENDGLEINKKIEMLLSSDTPVGIAKSIGLGIISITEAFYELAPDMVILLGDRFETFSAAISAYTCKIPIAHIHGGETTEGAIDEAFRHSITKMAHLHFASCEEYRKRIIQLGESPDRIFNVGALGVENIKRIQLMKRDELAKSIGFNLDKPFFLVTYHPVTLEDSSSEYQFYEVLDALDSFPDHNILFTKTNADTDGRIINKIIDKYVVKNVGRSVALSNLGMRRYLSAMKYSSAVIGNSSSGIIEAPTLKTPTVNIGDRQKGRVQSASILNCSPDSHAICKTIEYLLSPSFQETIISVINPYEGENTCSEIVKILSKIELTSIIKKEFYNL